MDIKKAINSYVLSLPSSTATAAASEDAESDEERTEALNTLLLYVNSKKEAAIRDVVTAIGTHITAPKEEIRQRSMLLLSEVFTRLPALSLSPQTLKLVVEFYTARLSDHSCSREVLMGLFALIKNHSLHSTPQPSSSSSSSIAAAPPTPTTPTPSSVSSPLVATLLTALPSSLPVQTLVQAARKFVFDILVLIAAKYPSEVLARGTTFITDWIGAADGEKDPRNLMNAFWMTEFIVRQFSDDILTPATAELFDITSCYFPITFTPPKNDPYNITGDDLKLALTGCLTGTPLFAPLLFPFMLEKMEAAEASVKIDALISFERGAIAFGSDQIIPFAAQLWASLMKEIMLSADNAVVTAGLSLIKTMFTLLLPDYVSGHRFIPPTTSPNDKKKSELPAFSQWIDPILRESIEAVSDQPDSKMARLHAMILTAAAAASRNSADRILALFFPAIKTKINSPHIQPSQRLALFEVMSALVEVAARVPLHRPHSTSSAASSSSSSPSPASAIAPYISEIVTLYSATLMSGDSDQRIAAIRALGMIGSLNFQESSLLSPPSAPIKPGISPLPKPLASAMGPSKPSTAAMDISSDSKIPVSTAASSDTSLLSADQFSGVTKALLHNILFVDPTESVRHAALDSIVRIASAAVKAPTAHSDVARSFVAAVSTVVLEGVTSSQPSAASTSTVTNNPFPLRTLPTSLTAIMTLSIASPHIFAVALPVFASIIQKHFSAQSAVSSSALSSALTALRAIITKVASETDSQKNIPNAAFDLVPLLLSSLISTALISKGPLDTSLIEITAGILQTLSRIASPAVQRNILTATIRAYLSGDTAGLSKPATAASASSAPFMPLSTKSVAPLSQIQLIPLLTAVVSAHRLDKGSDAFDLPQRTELITALLQFLQSYRPTDTTLHPAIHSAAILSVTHCLSSIINKLPVTDPALKQFVDDIVFGSLLPTVAKSAATDSADSKAMSIDPTIQPNKGSALSMDPPRALQCLIWMAKALITRGHTATNRLAAEFVTLLSHPNTTISRTVADGFDIILSDSEVVLTRETHANIAALHKQRFFGLTLPLILSAYRTALSNESKDTKTPSTLSASSAMSDVKGLPTKPSPASAAAAASASAPSPSAPRASLSLLLAVTHSLRHIPRSVLIDSLKETLPLLIRSLLPSSDPTDEAGTKVTTELRTSTLITLSQLIRGGGSAATMIATDLNSLIPALLRLTRYKPAMRIRMSAIDCLEALTCGSITFASIYPYRTSVTNSLATVLADHKRIVRRAAVRCRNEWFVLTNT